MVTKDSIKNIERQYDFVPEISGGENLVVGEQTIVAGMGGSGLPATVANQIWPEINYIPHRDYNLPAQVGRPAQINRNFSVVVISHSGNTEEALSAYDTAIKNNLPCAVITTGGTLLKKAESNNTPFVLIPKNKGEEPRLTVWYMLRALLTLTGHQEKLAEIKLLKSSVNPEFHKKEAQELAWKIAGHIPIFYSSNHNSHIAYNWKIHFNETAKIPGFINTIPESNHNELEGFNATNITRNLTGPFCFLLGTDNLEHPRVKKRFEALKEVLKEKEYPVYKISIMGSSQLEKFANSMNFAVWTSVFLAEIYKQNQNQETLISQFKQKMAE